MIHRDLKPENVVLSAEDASVRVVDFGLAKVMGPPPANASVFENTDSVSQLSADLLQAHSGYVLHSSVLLCSLLVLGRSWHPPSWADGTLCICSCRNTIRTAAEGDATQGHGGGRREWGYGKDGDVDADGDENGKRVLGESEVSRGYTRADSCQPSRGTSPVG